MKRSTELRLCKKAACWRRIIAYEIFNAYYYDGDYEGTLAKIRKHLPVLKKYLEYLHWSHAMLCKRQNWKYEPDLRSGKETYGYKDQETNEANLSYISDRFAAEFRIQWMIDLVEQ